MDQVTISDHRLNDLLVNGKHPIQLGDILSIYDNAQPQILCVFHLADIPIVHQVAIPMNGDLRGGLCALRKRLKDDFSVIIGIL